jgi:drug/metabolite transporter (DMT)-like permease
MAMNWVVLATVSALLSAAAAVAQKRTLFRVGALEFSFLVSAAVLALTLFVPFTQDVLALSPRAFAVLGIKSLVGGVAFLLVMMALERNPISGALPVLGLTPAVTGVLATLLLRDTLGPGEWAGLALMTAGLYALEAKPRGGLVRPLAEAVASGRHRLMFGAVLLFALSSVGDKLLVSGMRVPPNVVLFHQHVVYTSVFGVLLLVRRVPLATLARGVRSQWPMLLAIAVLTLGYRFFQLQATRTGPVALVLAVKRTSILYATLAGGRLFSEQRLGPRALAALLIVAAGFLFLGRE